MTSIEKIRAYAEKINSHFGSRPGIHVKDLGDGMVRISGRLGMEAYVGIPEAELDAIESPDTKDWEPEGF